MTNDAQGRRRGNCVRNLAGAALALALLAPGPVAHAQADDAKPAEGKGGQSAYQTIYLRNATQQNDLNDIQTALRNMLPKAKIYGVPSQSAISLWASAEDIEQAEKIVADLDKTRPAYRLTYTITESEGDKRTGTQKFTLIVVSGARTVFKQGSRVPIVTGSTNDSGASQNQVTYIDVGLSIEANVDGSPDGVRVYSKIQQSGVADEKSVLGGQDPVIRQNTLDGTSILTPGKPLVVGALDVPGSTRHEDVEVVAELVR
jgi:type II secretory pathway component GspD/PulD (secretin)